jgi:hypothetical protein
MMTMTIMGHEYKREMVCGDQHNGEGRKERTLRGREDRSTLFIYT